MTDTPVPQPPMKREPAWAGAAFDGVLVLVVSGLFAHHDLSQTVFLSIILPIVGARAALLKSHRGGVGGSAALALCIGLASVLVYNRGTA